MVITPGGIATALAHLGIPAMNRAVKDGWQVEFSTPPVRVNRRGYQAVFSLPMGVTPEMIADKRDVLARNLVRAPVGGVARRRRTRRLRGSVGGRPGLHRTAAPPYPLLHEGRADVFTGVPLGVSQRGDVIAIELPGANLVYGGLMGQGKSNAARVTMLGAALDPLAVLWVFVFANNGDFDAYQPRLARYHRGVDDHDRRGGVGRVAGAVQHGQRPRGRLADLGAKKVTRALAEKHPELRPVVALFSECHELFGHPGFGQEAADLAAQVLRRGRKAAVTLAFDTQSSRADAIPPRIVELVKINACFAVKAWRSNDGFLGDGSFQAGIRATELRPGKDVGTSIVTGATAGAVRDRQMVLHRGRRRHRLRRRRRRHRPRHGLPRPAHTDRRARRRAANQRPATCLADLVAVLGEQRVPAADVPARLRDLAPDHAPYRGLTGVKLREILEREYGIKVASTGNRYPVDPHKIRACIARRAADDLDDRSG